MEYYTDQQWGIWEQLEDGKVRYIFGVEEGLGTGPGKPMRKDWVEATWGPLEVYPPK